MVIYAAHEDRIATFGRECSIALATFDYGDIPEPGRLRALAYLLQSFRINFRREDAPAWADLLGHRDGDLSLAGADIGDYLARL